jgi:hypothetical protein
MLFYYEQTYKGEELDGPEVNALLRAIEAVKQRWSVIEWVTKYLLSRATPCFGIHVKPLVSAAFGILGPRGGLWTFSLYVQSIRKACVPAVGTLIG